MHMRLSQQWAHRGIRREGMQWYVTETGRVPPAQSRTPDVVIATGMGITLVAAWRAGAADMVGASATSKARANSTVKTVRTCRDVMDALPAFSAYFLSCSRAVRSGPVYHYNHRGQIHGSRCLMLKGHALLSLLSQP
jgi:hypothetical protein